MTDTSSTGGRIKYLRNHFNLTQVMLAEKIHVSKSAISAYEKGKRQPGLDKLVLLADVFRTSTDFLLCRESVTAAEDDVLVSLKGLKSNQKMLVRDVITQCYEATQNKRL